MPSFDFLASLSHLMENQSMHVEDAQYYLSSCYAIFTCSATRHTPIGAIIIAVVVFNYTLWPKGITLKAGNPTEEHTCCIPNDLFYGWKPVVE